MRSAILAAAITVAFAVAAVTASVLLAGWDAAQAHATPSPTPNTAPKEH